MSHARLALLAALGCLAGCGAQDLPATRAAGNGQSSSSVSIATRDAPVDLDGDWVSAGENDRLPLVGDKPQLTPVGRKLFDAHRAAAAKGDRSWDGVRRCLPPGVPRVLAITQPFAIASDAHLLLMSFQLQRLVRFVYLDDAFPADGDSSFLGESRGRWDGHALLIETRHFAPGLVLDGTGLPAGARLTVTERLEMPERDALVDHVTISDEEMYSRPWQAELHFRRSAQRPREDVCVERTGLHP